ncbi:MAG: ABC transporter substrate-binding protein [Anaerolineales bacterium]
MKKQLYVLVALLVTATMVLTACGAAATTAAPATAAPATAAPATAAPATAAPATAAPATAAPVNTTLPRNETLYFNGLQWGSVVCWNPYSSSCNNAMAIAPGDNALETMFETAYMYDMMDGKSYPLIADGPWAWNAAGTDITFKIKAAAKWSDGTPITADDFAYTWASVTKYKTGSGVANAPYIANVTAVDPQTVDIAAVTGTDGKPVNPLVLYQYLDGAYVIQKAWTQKLEARTGGDATKFMADTATDVVYSGPYHFYYADDTKVILVRDDKYWGQDASMWGKLAVPQYLAHTIFKDNASGSAALALGEVDVSQQFNSNVQLLWLQYGLPVSTYLPQAPYDIAASLPTVYYNMASYGLDQVAVRQAIAMAVDYDTINANAMTYQSPTFAQAPRSLMNPTPGEQALYDSSDPAIKALQWTGKDIAGADALLDKAGITKGADGWRTYKGKKLTYVATCPNGWSDWQAAIEQVAAAGKAIGIDITTNYPEWAVYQTEVTNWPLPAGFDLFMMYNDGAGPAEPWARTNHLLNSMFAETKNNWNGDWGGYKNPAVDAILNALPAETDPAKIKADYTQLTKIYLTDVPSFTVMYRPQDFHTVNESVWTGYPHQGDGTNPVVPPLDLVFGYSIAGLYNVKLVGK